jgi:hypothetical protein
MKESGPGKFGPLSLSTDATGLWYGLKDEVTRRKASDWSHVRDFAEKAVNNATRFAGLMTVFEEGFDPDSPSPTSRDSLWRAWQAEEMHMQNAARLFAPPPQPVVVPLPQRPVRAEVDAQKVLDCLASNYVNRGRLLASVSELGLLLGFSERRMEGAFHALRMESVIVDGDLIDGRLDLARMMSRSHAAPAWISQESVVHTYSRNQLG